MEVMVAVQNGTLLRARRVLRKEKVSDNNILRQASKDRNDVRRPVFIRVRKAYSTAAT